MSSSRKKVIVRRFSRDWIAGYVSPLTFPLDGAIELLDLDGKVIRLSLDQVKWVCFVRDFDTGDNPERLTRRAFSARPRTEGLWLRLRLRDNDTIEGHAANDLSLLDQNGLLLTPPDTRSNTQRIFIPRSAIAELTVVAVIGAPSKLKPATVMQERLFSPPHAVPKARRERSATIPA
jgi:hypothetical protein